MGFGWVCLYGWMDDRSIGRSFNEYMYIDGPLTFEEKYMYMET